MCADSVGCSNFAAVLQPCAGTALVGRTWVNSHALLFPSPLSLSHTHRLRQEEEKMRVHRTSDFHTFTSHGSSGPEDLVCDTNVKGGDTGGSSI